MDKLRFSFEGVGAHSPRQFFRLPSDQQALAAKATAASTRDQRRTIIDEYPRQVKFGSPSRSHS